MTAILISLFALVLSGIGLYLTRTGQRANVDWQRQRASHDTLNSLVTGYFATQAEQLAKLTNYRLHDLDGYEEALKQLGEGNHTGRNELDSTLLTILNMLTNVCVQLRNDVLDEKTCFAYLGYIIPTYWKWSNRYVRDAREKRQEPRLFMYLEVVAKDWESRKPELERKVQADLEDVHPKDTPTTDNGAPSN